MTIPARMHFCWIGDRLPWAYVFAVLSAAERSELPEIVLHHTDALVACDELAALQAARTVRLDRIDPDVLLAQAGGMLGIGDALAALHRRLADPVMRSDVLRAAILYLQGGIYADLDTVTVASLRPLIRDGAFVGIERIVWPLAARRSRSPFRLARHLALDLLRKGLRAVPDGWRGFRRIEVLYPRGVNNAVMGSEPGSTLMAAYLRAMVALPPEAQTCPYGLGPHLLDRVVRGLGPDQPVIHDPSVFYPLAPEISEHWFRNVHTVRLDEALAARTRIVHWYASVRTRSRVALISPHSVRQNRHRQLYSALVCTSIASLPGVGRKMEPMPRAADMT